MTKEAVNMTLEEQFEKSVGMPLEKVVTLYQRAVENDWRTVEGVTQQAFVKFSAELRPAELVNLARAILAGENGGHLRVAGLAGPVE
jgi:hypothetical protein